VRRRIAKCGRRRLHPRRARGCGGLILCRKRESCGECTYWAWRHHRGADCCRECARCICTTFQDLRGERAHVEKDQALRIVAYWRGEGSSGRGCASRRKPCVNGEVERRFSRPSRRLWCVGDSFAKWINSSEFVCKSTSLMPNRTNNA
jgi:hypothetical protein